MVWKRSGRYHVSFLRYIGNRFYLPATHYTASWQEVTFSGISGEGFESIHGSSILE
jgi:hypothetical protein